MLFRITYKREEKFFNSSEDLERHEWFMLGFVERYVSGFGWVAD